MLKRMLQNLCSAGLVASCPAIVFAQSSYFATPAAFYPVATQQILALTCEDINGDGVPDLMAARRYDSQVSVHINDGLGGFGAEILTNVDGPVVSIAAADFNGDGVIDIATSNQAPFNVSVRLGNGDGTFYAPAVPVFTSPTNNGIRSGDFDGDGWSDLAIINSTTGDSKVRIYRNDADGAGSFTYVGDYAVGDRPQARHMVIHDFDGINGPDVAVLSGEQQKVTLLRNDGSGGFSDPAFPAVEITGLLYGGAALDAADIDNDGDMDLVATSNNSGGYSVLLDTSGNGTAFQVMNHQPSGWATPAGFDIGDVDEDGNDDLVISDYGGPSTTYVLLGFGDGTFSASAVESFSFAGAGAPGAPCIADFAPGGELDIALHTRWTGGIYVQVPQAPQLVDLSGMVLPDCSEGLVHGIEVMLFDASDDLIAEATTDGSGSFAFMDVARGIYDLLVVTPLGYEGVDPVEIDLHSNAVEDVTLVCASTPWNTRTKAYWKRNVKKHVKGLPGGTQVSEQELLDYALEIYDHFYDFSFDPIDIEGVTFMMTEAGPMPMDLAAMDGTLRLRQATQLEKAKKHFLALLLNAASNRIGMTTVISDDGHTASEAITFIADAILDGDPTNDVTAKMVARKINACRVVPAGTMPPPAGIPNYAYRMPWNGNFDIEPTIQLGVPAPNPSSSAASIDLQLPVDGAVMMSIHDVTGRKVRTLLSGYQAAGIHTVSWDGRDEWGVQLPGGVYHVRATASGLEQVRKLIRVR